MQRNLFPGVQYDVLDNYDGQLLSILEIRLQVIKIKAWLTLNDKEDSNQLEFRLST